MTANLVVMGAENPPETPPQPVPDDPADSAEAQRAQTIERLAPIVGRQLLGALPQQPVRIDLMGRRYLVLDQATLPPPAPVPSIPVRAARSTYKLTRLGFAVLGIVVALAESLSSNHAVLRAVLDALVQASATAPSSPSSPVNPQR